MPQPHGRIESTPAGLRIVIEREVEFDLPEIWNTFTTPEGLAGWVGILRGTRETNDLRFSMVEQGQESEPSNLEIHRCREPQQLGLTTHGEQGTWKLGLELSRNDATSTIRFSHDLGPMDDPSTIGPGWEYYVQRAIVSLAGGDVDSVTWEHYYPALAPTYTPTPD